MQFKLKTKTIEPTKKIEDRTLDVEIHLDDDFFEMLMDELARKPINYNENAEYVADPSDAIDITATHICDPFVREIAMRPWHTLPDPHAKKITSKVVIGGHEPNAVTGAILKLGEALASELKTSEIKKTHPKFTIVGIKSPKQVLIEILFDPGYKQQLFNFLNDGKAYKGYFWGGKAGWAEVFSSPSFNTVYRKYFKGQDLSTRVYRLRNNLRGYPTNKYFSEYNLSVWRIKPNRDNIISITFSGFIPQKRFSEYVNHLYNFGLLLCEAVQKWRGD